MKKEEALLNGGIGRTYLSYLIPTIIGMLTNSVYCIVDVMFVGVYLGSEGLAAFNIAMPIFTIYSSIGLMLGVGGATTMSVLIGMGEKNRVNQVFTMTVLTSAGIGLLMTVGGLVFLRPLAMALGAPPELVRDVMEYLFPLQVIAMFYILNGTLQVVIRADYNPKLVMAAAVSGNAMNILFDWLFVGVFHWGLAGASTATALGPITAIIILSFHYILRKNSMHFTRKFFDRALFLRIFRNGVGTCILEFSSGAVVMMFNFVLLRVSGQAAVAVYAIVSNIAYVGKGIFNGISQAAQPLISVNYGAANYPRIQKSQRVAVGYAIGFALICYAAILIFPEQIVRVFIGSDLSLLEMGISASKIYFISFVFTAVNSVLMYYFQSVENIKITTLIALLRGVAFVVLGLCIFPWVWKETGVWLTITFAEVLTLLLVFPIKRRFDMGMRSRFNLQNQADTAHPDPA